MGKRLIIVTLIVLALVAAAAAGGWWYLTQGRFSLAGETRHEFGAVEVGGVDTAVTHTFVLTNKRSEPLTIEKVTPNCTCVGAEVDTREVAPGGEVQVEVELRLDRGGNKVGRVELALSDDTVQTLWVYAEGIKEYTFYFNQVDLSLVQGEPVPLVVFAEVQTSDDPPPVPTVTAPPGVQIEHVAWESVRTRDSPSGTAKWRGKFQAEMVQELEPGLHMLTMQLGKETIELRIIPRKKMPGDVAPGRALPADGGRPTGDDAKPSVDGPG